MINQTPDLMNVVLWFKYFYLGMEYGKPNKIWLILSFLNKKKEPDSKFNLWLKDCNSIQSMKLFYHREE